MEIPNKKRLPLVMVLRFWAPAIAFALFSFVPVAAAQTFSTSTSASAFVVNVDQHSMTGALSAWANAFTSAFGGSASSNASASPGNLQATVSSLLEQWELMTLEASNEAKQTVAQI